MGEVPELRENLCQESGVLDDRISAEETELLEKKLVTKDLLKARRKTRVEVWRDTVAARVERVTQKAAAGSRSSEASSEFIRKTRWRVRILLAMSRRGRRTGAIVCKESAEPQDYVSELLRMSHLDRNVEAEDEKNTEEMSFVPSAVSEPRWALRMCDKKCGAKGFKFFAIAAVSEGGAAHTINFCRNCCDERRVN